MATTGPICRRATDLWPLLQVLDASLGQATLEQLWSAKEQMDAAAGIEPQPPAIADFLHSTLD